MAKLGGGTAGYTYAWHNQLYVRAKLGVAQPAICLAQPAISGSDTAGYMLGTACYM